MGQEIYLSLYVWINKGSVWRVAVACSSASEAYAYLMHPVDSKLVSELMLGLAATTTYQQT